MLDLPKIRKNQFIEIIPLSTGCLGSCTYCKTRHARGKLGSYAPQAIVDRAKLAIEEGVKEIWLTSEDTGAYGRDIGTDITVLLKAIIKEMPEGTMLRLGMTNPPYILEHLQAMSDILKHPRVYSFLHVPVQSGSNPVLDKMNREYTVEEFMEVADFLQENAGPEGITLATDIICGFPTETDEHFKETLELVEKYKFPVLNISQFYPRPGTVAAKWKKVPTHDVKKRSNDLTKLFESYSTNTHYIGTEQLVWIIGFDDRKTKSDKDKPQLMGHTKAYTKVVLSQEIEIIGDQPAETLIGKCVKIKVTETHKWHISGYIIDAFPKLPEVPADYFERLEKERAEKEKQEDNSHLLNAKVVIEEVIEERIMVKNSQSQVMLHFVGMVVLMIGFYGVIKGITLFALN